MRCVVYKLDVTFFNLPSIFVAEIRVQTTTKTSLRHVYSFIRSGLVGANQDTGGGL